MALRIPRPVAIAGPHQLVALQSRQVAVAHQASRLVASLPKAALLRVSRLAALLAPLRVNHRLAVPQVVAVRLQVARIALL